MTPLMRQLYLAGGRIGLESSPTPLTEFLCFEMTQVINLAKETIKTLNEHTSYDDTHKPECDHGGLLVMPSDNVWLEWLMRDDEGTERAGVTMIRTEEDLIHVSGVSEAVVRHGSRRIPFAVIRLLPDDKFRVEVSKTDNYDDELMILLGGRMAMYAVVNLIILNAPYGIRKDLVPIHRGHLREARRAGATLRPHHVVYLDKTRPPPPLADGTPRVGPAFHKAFHFVRSHLRHFRDGGHTLVHAHWRGDPRLGICKIPDYKVRS